MPRESHQIPNNLSPGVALDSFAIFEICIGKPFQNVSRGQAWVGG
jgi:hypothetical protein